MQLTRGAWAVLGGTVAFLIVSFMPWQSALDGLATASMWQGVGVLAGLVALALAVLMGLRASNTALPIPVPLQMPTLALSALLALLAFIKFLTADEFRTAWAWIGLLLALGIFVAAYVDAATLLRMFRAMRSGTLPGSPGAFKPSAPATTTTPTTSTDRSSDVPGIDGDWQCTMSTPMGDQQVQLTLATDGTKLSGRANTAFGVNDFTDGTVDGNELAWHISATQPMPMEFDFTATVDGDAISGMVSAGPLGESPFTGTRA